MNSSKAPKATKKKLRHMEPICRQIAEKAISENRRAMTWVDWEIGYGEIRFWFFYLPNVPVKSDPKGIAEGLLGKSFAAQETREWPTGIFVRFAESAKSR